MIRLATLLVVLSAMGTPLCAQISPGPLARAHTKLEGSTNCVQCHGLKKEPMAQRCLACHKEVAWLIEQNRGVHAPARNVPKKECAQCHPDHAGLGFDMVDWGKGGSSQFDHKKAGWELDGKHGKAKCTACHAPEFRKSPAAALSPRTTGAGWMGLETTCISCHARDDVHKNALGKACEKCHDAADWKKPTRFDHAKSSYPLTGKHEKVECDKCHKAAKLNLKPDADGRIIGKYKPLPFEECSTCHADPHKGRLSAKCSGCHNTRDFKDVNRKEFDHSKTRYPLTGKHLVAQCESCHGVNLTKKAPVFAKCEDCHVDVHYGRGTLRGQPADCAGCHSTSGFAPSTYTVQQHASATFVLGGRHADVKCSLCHVASDSVLKGAPRVVVRRVQLRPLAACATCHADAHNGELSRSPDSGKCSSCHDDRGWAPTTFTVARHAALKLSLDGAHQPLACNRCHVPVKPTGPAVLPTGRKATGRVPLRVAAACESCHLDPHGGRYLAGSKQAPADGCSACHDSRRFVPSTLAVARHEAFGYPLDGAHRSVPCRDCHKELGVASKSSLKVAGTTPVARLPFTAPRRSACATCHVDPHGGQFAANKRGSACDVCHVTATWVGAALFVHDRDSSFPLAGAHMRVPCVACHVHTAQSGGGDRVQYRSLPTACEGCHKDATVRKRP
jgi:hypothetical protein